MSGSACGLFPRPWILKTDAKAPTWSLPWTDMRVGMFMVEFLVKSIRIRPFRREQLHPLGFFKLVTHKEGIVLCLHPLFNVTPIQGGKSMQLLTPTERSVAYITELRRDDNFLQCHTIQKDFFANLTNYLDPASTKQCFRGEKQVRREQ